MHPILTIAKFELSKKKVALKPSAIIGLLIVFLLFSGAFFLLSHFGYKPQHYYYSIATSPGPLDEYIKASDSMRIANRGSVQVYPRLDGSYLVDSANRFEELSATTALVNEVRLQNRELLISSGVQPPFLVLLNITTRHREEILAPPQSIKPLAPPNISVNGTRVTVRDSATVTAAPKSAAAPTESSIVIPGEGTGGIQLTTQQITRATPALNGADNSQLSNISSFSRAPVNVTSAVPDGLTYPDDLNTLVGVKHLFILIQLMLVFNFFSALLGNSFFEEKLNYRSSLLFSAPLLRRFVVIGKLLPYLLLSFVMSIILVGVQYPYLLLQPLFYFLVFVLALVYFSLSFLNGLLARSNKEYSFLNVFTTSILSLYLLIPAFIANYSTLGYASLLTPILLLAQQLPVSLSLVLFLGTIYAALAAVIFIMGSALWNFEHLYKYESPFKKIMYIIRTNTKSAWQYFFYGACCVPFLWLAQIVLIALFLVIPLQNKLFLLLFGAAICEEFVRTLASRSHILHARASALPLREAAQSWKQALLVGLGFGLTEKIILFAAIAPYLEGYQYIVTAGIIIPIALHTLFTYFFSIALRKYDWCARHANLVCIGLALLHSTFNYFIITTAGVSLI